MLETLPLSLLNDYLYCRRRAALKVVEGWREANEHTVRGDIVHDHADTPGYEVAKGVMLLRALPVWSDKLGINGKCDIVEEHKGGVLIPVEFKVGKRRQWENDDAQVCAQALCLEEMFGQEVRQAAIFHSDSKRRRTIELTDELRGKTIRAIEELHRLLESEKIPVAVYKEACEECSLFEICLPKATGDDTRGKRIEQNLFKV